ncbi:hypothetical protein [Mumia zhuanghuii]|uniref:Uncharacterized protein n=1 Tax=Mumia zhuanghuii TaxID=2585211 RepID=A0A5C4MF70_9ACTN|nr:hypothetical protein [Mumia zhuanghuii]TNC36453.1 hypothetical protein FHE65_26240 [Mumia zhuanghuii]
MHRAHRRQALRLARNLLPLADWVRQRCSDKFEWRMFLLMLQRADEWLRRKRLLQRAVHGPPRAYCMFEVGGREFRYPAFLFQPKCGASVQQDAPERAYFPDAPCGKLGKPMRFHAAELAAEHSVMLPYQLCEQRPESRLSMLARHA